MTMNEYMSQAKDIFNHLLVVGDPISRHNQVKYLVNGLSFEYNSLITTLTYKKIMPTLEEVFTMIKVHEQKIKRTYFTRQSSIHVQTPPIFPL